MVFLHGHVVFLECLFAIVGCGALSCVIHVIMVSQVDARFLVQLICCDAYLFRIPCACHSHKVKLLLCSRGLGFTCVVGLVSTVKESLLAIKLGKTTAQIVGYLVSIPISLFITMAGLFVAESAAHECSNLRTAGHDYAFTL